MGQLTQGFSRRRPLSGAAAFSCLAAMGMSAAAVVAVAAPADAQEGTQGSAADNPKPYRLFIESGAVWQTRNVARIPGDGGTDFSLTRLIGAGPNTYLRLTLFAPLSGRDGLRLVYSPLRIQGTGRLERTTEFAGSQFSPSADTEATYKFNSYRLTYWRAWQGSEGSRWQTRYGFTAKIRDAEVRLRQGGTEAKDDNVGFVPLLHFSGEWQPFNDTRWRILVDLDALGAPQGRAIDLGLQASRDLGGGYSVFAGWRTLEGGADNEQVFSFAWLNYATLGAGLRF